MHNIIKKKSYSCSSNTILILSLKERNTKWRKFEHTTVTKECWEDLQVPVSPLYPRHFLFFSPHQEIYFSPMKLFRFPHKRSPMKIYMRSFRRWFIPKIRSIKWKILFILFLFLLSTAHFSNFSRNLGSFLLLLFFSFFF